MALAVDIPGLGTLELDHLFLDVNGTLTDRGRLLDGVGERLVRLSVPLHVLLASADTFGTLRRLAGELGVDGVVVADGAEKRRLVERLGADRTAVIGNGANDAGALEAAALGIAVIGPEGAAAAALRAADIVSSSIVEALDLLLDERALKATLRM